MTLLFLVYFPLFRGKISRVEFNYLNIDICFILIFNNAVLIIFMTINDLLFMARNSVNIKSTWMIRFKEKETDPL